MLVNYFTVGEADDGCGGGGSIDDGMLVPIALDPTRADYRDQVRARSSVRVSDLFFPGAHHADVNGDGIVNATDIRAFARENRLPLSREFIRKLEKLERSDARRRRLGVRR